MDLRRQPEVKNFDPFIGRDHDIGRFDIPVDNIHAVGMIQSCSDLFDDRQDLFKRELFFFFTLLSDPPTQIFPLTVFHDEIISAVPGVKLKIFGSSDILMYKF